MRKTLIPNQCLLMLNIASQGIPRGNICSLVDREVVVNTPKNLFQLNSFGVKFHFCLLTYFGLLKALCFCRKTFSSLVYRWSKFAVAFLSKYYKILTSTRVPRNQSKISYGIHEIIQIHNGFEWWIRKLTTNISYSSRP